MERCSRVLIDDPAALRGRWKTAVPGFDALWLELGCGKGRFTADTAEQNPRELLVALEKVPDVMVMAMERCCERDLQNVRFIDGDALALPVLFEPDEVDRIYINFCDPWPTKRHAKRRLTHGNFLKLYRKVLKEDRKSVV